MFWLFLCGKVNLFFFFAPLCRPIPSRQFPPLSLIPVVSCCIHEFRGLPFLRLPRGGVKINSINRKFCSRNLTLNILFSRQPHYYKANRPEKSSDGIPNVDPLFVDIRAESNTLPSQTKLSTLQTPVVSWLLSIFASSLSSLRRIFVVKIYNPRSLGRQTLLYFFIFWWTKCVQSSSISVYSERIHTR